MAKVSVYLRKECSNWFLRYRDKNGDIKRLSTKTSDKAKALKMAGELQKHLLTIKSTGLEVVGLKTGAPTWAGYYEKIDALAEATVAASKKQCARATKLAHQQQALMRELVLRLEATVQAVATHKIETSDLDQ